MFGRVRYAVGALALGTALVLLPVSGVQAQGGNQQDADGFVNVQVGDVTILESVAIAAAVAAVAQICPAVNVSNVAALAAAVDQRGGESRSFCEGTAQGTTGEVRIVDNDDDGNGGGNQQNANGLVNVQVGNVTVAENVGIGVAAGIVAQLCPSVNVSNVALLAADVAQEGGTSEAICNATANGTTGPVTITDGQ